MAALNSGKVLVSEERSARIVRSLMLLMAMLLSGGNVAIPRLLPLAVLLVTIGMIVNPTKALRPELSRIWLLLATVFVVSLIGAGGLDLESTAVRYANFLAAILVLIVYLDLGRGQMMRDAWPVFIFFGVQAILTPILALTLSGLFTTFLVGETVYSTLGFIFTYHETVGDADFLGLRRADGFFFEPGVFQIYLNLFLYTALFHKRNLGMAGLAIGGVMATQSTTGVVIAFMLCALFVLNQLRRMQASSALLFVVSAPFVLAPIAWLTYQNILSKLFGGAAGSATARSFDAQTGMRIVAEHPIFGIGFSHERLSEEFYYWGRSVDTTLGDGALDRTMSNGVIHLAVVVGIPLALVFFYALMRQRLFGHGLIVGGLVLLSMTTEAIVLTPFFLAIIFSGLISSKRKERKHRSAPIGRAPSRRPLIAPS